MKITFVLVGNIKNRHVSALTDEYIKRIKRYVRVEEVVVKEEVSHANALVEAVLDKEALRIVKRLAKTEFAVALTPTGRRMSSSDFAGFIERRMTLGCKGITFIVGASFGLGKGVTERADAVLSLSDMTLPHELAALCLAEQIYRAFTIIRGEPYSH
ncbi:MAG: 23S rRNA (pseudouridine(1915)-N(3))-methyltransferase RlmH [Deltaproteobacteria bacterium]|nr:23S rRNA (pseudouridine(1915)-N(3))-methyltransferase RlmH [Deltaproteobacteria bacterium]